MHGRHVMENQTSRIEDLSRRRITSCSFSARNKYPAILQERGRMAFPADGQGADASERIRSRVELFRGRLKDGIISAADQQYSLIGKQGCGMQCPRMLHLVNRGKGLVSWFQNFRGL